MTPNPHALRVSKEYGRPYDEVRRAVNLLVGYEVTNRGEAERWVEEWAREAAADTDGPIIDLIDRAREEVEEAVRSQ